MPESNPPCSECDAACCNGNKFDSVHISKREVRKLRNLGAKITKDKCHNTFSMNITGGCPFLKYCYCSIYEKRPLSCQNYDCRPDREKWDS